MKVEANGKVRASIKKRAKFKELREAFLAGLKKVRGVYSLDMNLSSCSKTTIGKDTCA